MLCRYDIMLSTWSDQSDDRPTFKEIHHSLTDMMKDVESELTYSYAEVLSSKDQISDAPISTNKPSHDPTSPTSPQYADMPQLQIY